MLTLTLVFFLLVGGSFCRDLECRRRENENCISFHNMVPEFPLTKGEMDTACKHGIKVLECASDGFKKCGEEDTEDARYLRNLIFFVETQICNENSDIYEALSNNLQCIKKSSPEVLGTCLDRKLRQQKDEIVEEIGSHLNEVLGSEEETECIFQLFQFACASASFAEICGDSVGNAFMEIAPAVDPDFQSCPEEIVNYLPYVDNAIRSISEDDDDEFLRKK